MFKTTPAIDQAAGFEAQVKPLLDEVKARCQALGIPYQVQFIHTVTPATGPDGNPALRVEGEGGFWQPDAWSGFERLEQIDIAGLIGNGRLPIHRVSQALYPIQIEMMLRDLRTGEVSVDTLLGALNPPESD